MENSIPQELKTAVEEAPHVGGLEATFPHFNLVNHQLTTMRAQFAIATALSRVVVLPELLCGWDRFWGPIMGYLPGSPQFKQPFVCPADHVLEVEL